MTEPMAFNVDDYYKLRDILLSVAPAGAYALPDAEPTLQNFRRLLLASGDLAPDNEDVIRIFDTQLEPVPRDTREFIRASRRVCLIERKDGGESTGILIGPDILLTAAHALRGTAGIFADPKQVTVKFDQFFGNERRKEWRGSCGLLSTGGKTPQPVVLASSIKVTPDGTQIESENDLDYVILKLNHEIGARFLPHRRGRRRGWMDGSRAERVVNEGDRVTVLQHPQGELLQFSRGLVLERRDRHIRYRVDVNVGSSGAPILDWGKRIVGIHTGQIDNENQVGTSFHAIFEDIRKRFTGGFEEALQPFPPPPPPTDEVPFPAMDPEEEPVGAKK